jgi:predicted amidophosphoribosyltransferase
MPVCPSCGAEVRPGAAACPGCGTVLPGAASTLKPDTPEPGWATVYSGRGVELRMAEEALVQAGFTSIKTYEDPANTFPVAAFGTQDLTYYSIALPADEYQARREEIERITSEIRGQSPEDVEAQAEAEQDYDVRACPGCALFFHDTYSACPGCGAELVPAVEIFEAEQLAPDRVIVAHGTAEEMKDLAAQFQAQGFAAQANAIEDWTVAAVDLPWTELIDRTDEAEALLGS